MKIRNTRKILQSQTCESLLIFYSAYKNVSNQISLHQLICLIQFRTTKNVLTFKNSITPSIKNSMLKKCLIIENKGIIEISEKGYNILKKFSQFMTDLVCHKDIELDNLTEL